MSDDLVQKMAWAMFDRSCDEPWEDTIEITRTIYLEDARAVLRAMEEANKVPLMEGRAHLTVDGQFKSDKYPWCPVGFVPLKVTDEMAQDLLGIYAERRAKVDAEFARDLDEALEVCAWRQAGRKQEDTSQ